MLADRMRMVAEPFKIPMADFDGSTYLTRGADLTGVAGSKQGTISVFFDPATDAATKVFYMSGDQHFRFAQVTNDKLQIRGFNSSTTEILQLNSSSAFTVGGGPYHILASWDLATTTSHLYVNDVDELVETIITNDTIDHSATEHYIGRNTTAVQFMDGNLGQFYINEAEYVDLSVAANRRKFSTANSLPVDMGSDGSTPTGTAPIMFFNNPIASWQTNLGGGGGFTENGALLDGGLFP